MGWFNNRARRRRQAQLDAVDEAFGLDTPEARAQYERGRDHARIAAEAARQRREIDGLDALGDPKNQSGTDSTS